MWALCMLGEVMRDISVAQWHFTEREGDVCRWGPRTAAKGQCRLNDSLHWPALSFTVSCSCLCLIQIKVTVWAKGFLPKPTVMHRKPVSGTFFFTILCVRSFRQMTTTHTFACTDKCNTHHSLLTSGNTACGFFFIAHKIFHSWHDNLTSMFISKFGKYLQLQISKCKCTINRKTNQAKTNQAKLIFFFLCKKHFSSDKSKNLNWNKRH